MLFVVLLLKNRPASTLQEGGAHRLLQWEYPEGMNAVAECWLETNSPRVISVVEVESMAPFGAIRVQWRDLLDIDVFPALTAEQGMEMLRQAMSEQG